MVKFFSWSLVLGVVVSGDSVRSDTAVAFVSWLGSLNEMLLDDNRASRINFCGIDIAMRGD